MVVDVHTVRLGQQDYHTGDFHPLATVDLVNYIHTHIHVHYIHV